MFRALLLQKDDAGSVTAALADVNESMLPEGVVVDVEYSTINYKDGLAIANASPGKFQIDSACSSQSAGSESRSIRSLQPLRVLPFVSGFHLDPDSR